MLSHVGYHRSRVFKVSASLLLSTAYFVAAIGVWMVQQGRTDITADTASTTTTCTPASQATDTFNEQRVVSGGGIPVPTGWTADAGTVLAGYDRNISRDDTGDAWMRISGRIQRPVRESREGQITFRLASLIAYNVPPIPTVPAFDVTLLTKSGPPLALRISDEAVLTNNQLVSASFIKYRDPLTGEYKPVLAGQDTNPAIGTFTVSTGVNRENTLSRESTFTVRWTGTTFTIDSPFGGTSKSYQYAQNDATSITGISLSGQAADSATQPVMANLLAKDVVYPAGDTVPCVTAISPTSGSTGTVVTLNGNQFEASGMKVTMKPTTGDTITIESGITVTPGTATNGAVPSGGDTLTFTVPSSIANGSYQVGVTNSAGASKQTQTFTVNVACTPPTLQTETFDSYPLTEPVFSTGQSLSTIPGWTVTGGGVGGAGDGNPNSPSPYPKITQTLSQGLQPTGGRHISSTLPFKASHAFAPRRSGEVAIRPLWAGVGLVSGFGPLSFILSGESGPVIRVAVALNDAAPPSGPMYELSAIDLATSGSTSFTLSPLEDGIFTTNNQNGFAPPAANTLHFRWSPSGYDFLIGDRKLNSAPLNLPSAGLPIRMLTIEVTGQPAPNFSGVGGSAGFDDVTLPTGDAVPCVTSIAPASGPTGTEVTLTGSQFETSGIKVTMKPSSGDTLTVESPTVVDGTHLKFSVPSSAKAGQHQVGVTNAEGPSNQTQSFTVTVPGTLTVAVAPSTGVAPLAVTITANGLASGTSLTYDFGDGSAKAATSDTSVKHTYTRVGDQTVTVTGGGQTATAKVRVQAASATASAAASGSSATGTATGSGATGTAAGSGAAASATVDTGSSPAKAAAAAVTSAAKLVASGGSLWVNLLIALLFSLLTTVSLLRHPHRTTV